MDMKNISLHLNQYNKETDIKIGEYDGDWNTFIKVFPDYKKYYWRIRKWNQNSPQKRVKTNYFGVDVSCVNGLKFTSYDYLNNFINYALQHDNWNIYNVFELAGHRAIWIGQKFKWINSLSKTEFNELLNEFIDRRKFIEIYNLNDVKKCSGIYVLVLDEYNCAYIGQAQDICKRIKQHWSNSTYFTGTGIDLFKPYDTTRIFYKETNNLDENEYKCITDILNGYLLNSLNGSLFYLLENNLKLITTGCEERNK